MNKKKTIMTLLSIMLLLFPVAVFAEEEHTSVEDEITIKEEVESKKEKTDKEKPSEEEQEIDSEENDNSEESSEIEVPTTPQNNLPLVIINVEEDEQKIAEYNEQDPNHTYGNIEDINASLDHSVRGKGTFEIILPEGYVSDYASSTVPEGPQELDYIRGRGNVTWGYDKKPYKIKLNTKQDILGMGSNKEWALLANYMDKTLSNNAIVSWVSQEFGMEYSIQMVPVELVLLGTKTNAKLLGSYYLAELVDIGKSRVNIEELKEDMTSEENNITGGYIVSLYYEKQDYDKPENRRFTLESGLEFINENPDFENDTLTPAENEQKNYIRNYLQQIEDLILKNETINEDIHNKINDLMDLQSTADYFLMQEFFINFDAYKTSSNYLYKKRDGKLYWGPLWDFDLMFYMIDSKEALEGFDHYTSNVWIDELREKDPLFSKILEERWKVLEPILAKVTEKDGIIDQFRERQRPAEQIDYEIWLKDDYDESIYDEEFEILREKMDNRRDWINNNLSKLGETKYTVTLEVEDEVVDTIIVRAYSILDEIEWIPKKEGMLFEAWVDKETNEKVEFTKVTHNITVVPSFITVEEESELDFYLSEQEIWALLEEETFDNSSIIPVIDDNYDIICNNISWKSSNEEVGTISNGVVTLKSIGETTITATLNNITRSYLLHVYDEDQETVEDPVDIELENDTYTLEEGSTVQINHYYLPNLPITAYFEIMGEVEDEEIVEFDTSGFIIKGLKEGKTTITISLYSYETDSTIITKTVSVIVKPKKEEHQEEDKKDKKEEKHEHNTNKHSKNSNITTISVTNREVMEKNTKSTKNEKKDSKLEVKKKPVEKETETQEKETKKKIEVAKNNSIVWVVVAIAIVGMGIGLVLMNSQKKD